MNFNGFEPPIQNWSKLPHQLVEALPLIKTAAELKVIIYVLRHTWGFHDEWKKITTDEFVNGRKRKDGSRLDNGVGMSAPSVRSGIKAAVASGFLEVEIDETDKARVKKSYSLSQGVKDLPSDGKSLTTGGKESYYRTEKETSEQKPKEEKHIAGKKQPAPPVPINGKEKDLPEIREQPPAKKVSPKAKGPKTLVMDHFLGKTALPFPTHKPEIAFWWQGISILYNLGDKDPPKTNKLIDDTIAELDADDLTISGPNSLVKTARAIIAKRKRGRKKILRAV